MLNQRISFKMSLPFIWQETLRELVYLGIVTKKEYWATPEKKNQTREVEDILFWKNTQEFLGFLLYLPLEITHKTKVQPWKLCKKLCYTPRKF